MDRHELIGGKADDLTAVCEWCSLYAHAPVFSCVAADESAVKTMGDDKLKVIAAELITKSAGA